MMLSVAIISLSFSPQQYFLLSCNDFFKNKEQSLQLIAMLFCHTHTHNLLWFTQNCSEIGTSVTSKSNPHIKCSYFPQIYCLFHILFTLFIVLVNQQNLAFSQKEITKILFNKNTKHKISECINFSTLKLKYKFLYMSNTR